MKIRIENLKKLRELGINPYPSKIDIKGDLVSLESALGMEGKEVLVADVFGLSELMGR